MSKKLFDYVIGNPPYQEETGELKEGATNNQTPKKNVFHYMQLAADEIAREGTALIYPAGRWIQRSGKGMADFGFKQINDPHLSQLYVYPDSKKLFESASIADGISIVVKNMKKDSDLFLYSYVMENRTETISIKSPGEQILSLNPTDNVISNKLNEAMKKLNIPCMHDSIYPRTLFGIESSFAQDNPTLVSIYESNKPLKENEVKLLTNDKAGKAGRATWFVTDIENVPNNTDLIKKWKVVVSSANAGGQKRDRQLALLDNKSAFGRTRVALGLFDTKEEADNFYSYVDSDIIQFAFLLTDEALTSLGKTVPDIKDYKAKNKYIDFKGNIDNQLQKLFGLSDEEVDYIQQRLTERQNAK